ncbi:MAG: adenylosuccinate synthase [Candidatus Aenigmarchaeota archaeon]|nr:adenylosuccinate synthase [Candidatus Aenigmarchaeota archaeon]
MKAVAVVGMQFGDEAKGKIVDVLSNSRDVVAGIRFAGGNNAGHTVVFGGKEYKLHHIPSSIFHGKLSVIGHGTVVNPGVLLDEIRQLGALAENLRISPNVHVIMPYHIHEDVLLEAKKSSKVGTTGRGIGPCYADKANRIGIRIRELFDGESLNRKLEFLIPLKNSTLQHAYGWDGALDKDAIAMEYAAYGKFLKTYAFDGTVPEGTVLLEGAQGALLDIDMGTYPFVTSSHPTIGGALAGSGMPKADAVVGVMKAYTTRVGEGPFPTELTNEVGAKLRQEGREFGTTTGRPRRVGWLDIPMLKYAARVNGVTALALTKLDVLAGMPEIKIAVVYDRAGIQINALSHATDVADATPVYEIVKGWKALSQEQWNALAQEGFAALPEEAQEYVRLIERSLAVPVAIVSVGADRNATILRKPLHEL